MRAFRVFPVLALAIGIIVPASIRADVISQPSVFVEPSDGEVVYGAVDLVATLDPAMFEILNHPPVQFVATTASSTTAIGTDADGVEGSRGGWLCFTNGCSTSGVYHAVWNVPPNFPAGPAQLTAIAQVCDPRYGCQPWFLGQVSVIVEPTPAIPTLLTPAFGSKQLPLVQMDATVVGPDVVDVRFDVTKAAFPTPRNVPRFFQHLDGADITNDQDGDGRKGDNSCGPTAAASSLTWFSNTGTTGMMPTPDGDGGADPAETGGEEMVEQIGRNSSITNSGVTDPNLEAGIKKFLKDRGLDGKFDVGRKGNPGGAGIPASTIGSEFQRGQDVLLGFTPTGGGTGHWMTVNGVTPNADGSATVNVMDPWDGSYKDITVDKNGKTNYNGGGTIDGMIHVSPKTQVFSLATPLPSFSAGAYSAAWVMPIYEPGWYLFRVTATDSSGLALSDYSVAFVDP